jgi:hypothetical protein
MHEELVQAYFASGQMHYGVIFAVRRSPQEIAQRLLVILNQVTADEMLSSSAIYLVRVAPFIVQLSCPV